MEVKNLNDIDDKIGNTFKSNKEIAINQLEKIISKMPIEIEEIINDAFTLKRIPKEYLLSSILFSFSNACGLAFSIKAMGYTNYANLYFSIIGSRGDIKSPAMDLATFPLVKYDNEKYKEFKTENIELDEIEKISRKQLFLQDATIESAIFTHYKNKYSIGIFIDELYFIIEKMANKSSTEGTAWRTFFLQGNTNKYIDISRKTTESFRIEKSYPTLLGSIQNQFVPKLFADGNLESGLIDRILFTNKLTMNNQLSIDDISIVVSENYSKSLINLLNYRTEIENTFEMDDLQIELNLDAKKRLFDYSQELINRQNKAIDLSKEYISKMMINIHKITLLTHLILNSREQTYQSEINLETIEIAILILEFYFINFKIVLEENINHKEKLPTTEDVIRLAIKNNATQKEVVAITGMNKSSISRKWNNELLQLATRNCEQKHSDIQ
ncbi:DUF3987 domain-containing protein [Flavobacterium difficile]|jgi:hypothetical protein|uniref:DUF3987 domain-containing protein n=1 Tax=Flavobacterium difficile TaxID=2709659 RepID=A0ABX0I765_9FLAO|nr:DUF3987 domain-containing protein [Flavobacterium difficile]NHM02531.1 DUF3987 domain-containing protein [Flavobacterium difficile]